MCLSKIYHVNAHHIEDLNTLVHPIEDTHLEERMIENTYHLLKPIFSRNPHKASPILVGLLFLLYFISIFGHGPGPCNINVNFGGV